MILRGAEHQRFVALVDLVHELAHAAAILADRCANLGDRSARVKNHANRQLLDVSSYTEFLRTAAIEDMFCFERLPPTAGRCRWRDGIQISQP